MRKEHKKLSKNKRKFFIIASCYVAIFLITAIATMSTLAWFSSSTYATQELYMGGPVYIKFTNKDGTKETSGKNKMVVTVPPKWDKLYPGMNIHFESTCTVQGAKFENTKTSGETVIVYSTGAILRAKVLLKVTDPNGNIYPNPDSTPEQQELSKSLYDNLWPQLQEKAQNHSDNIGKWVFDYQNTESMEENYFYYVLKEQNLPDIKDYILVEVGGTEQDVAIGFLNDAVITLSGLGFENEHADCKIEFTIVYHALQAFLPYESKDVDENAIYQNDNSGRTVRPADVGMPKPLKILNARDPFQRAFSEIYN